MYYLAQTYSMLVVENPIEFLEQPDLLAADPDLSGWVPDESAIRREIVPSAPASSQVMTDIDTSQPKHKQTKTGMEGSEEVAASREDPNISNDEPLMTEEDISNLLADRTFRLNDRAMTRYTPAGSVETMLEEEAARHLATLTTSVVAAMKASIDILKFVKNHQLISSKSSAESMWWFHDRCTEISKLVAEGCPKAPKIASAHFPGIDVVQILPYNKIARLITRMQDRGFKALTHAHGQLTHKDNKLNFISNTSVGEVQVLRKVCWDLVGMVTNVRKLTGDTNRATLTDPPPTPSCNQGIFFLIH
jgi:hypothetical protein